MAFVILSAAQIAIAMPIILKPALRRTLTLAVSLLKLTFRASTYAKLHEKKVMATIPAIASISVTNRSQLILCFRLHINLLKFFLRRPSFALLFIDIWLPLFTENLHSSSDWQFIFYILTLLFFNFKQIIYLSVSRFRLRPETSSYTPAGRGRAMAGDRTPYCFTLSAISRIASSSQTLYGCLLNGCSSARVSVTSSPSAAVLPPGFVSSMSLVLIISRA